MATTVRIPPDDEKAPDRVVPITDFLIAVGLLVKVGATGTEGSPETVGTALADNTLAATKKVNWGILTTTGAGSVVGVIGAWRSALGNSDALTIALIAAIALILVAGMLGVSLVTNGDVRGRAAVATEIVRQRGTVTEALLASFDAAATRAASAAKGATAATPAKPEHPGPDDLAVSAALVGAKLTASTARASGTITAISWTVDDGLRVAVDGKDWAGLDELTALGTATS